jgi:hypothetical protein
MSTPAPPSATVTTPLSVPPLVAESPLRRAADWSWATTPATSPPALSTPSVAM